MLCGRGAEALHGSKLGGCCCRALAKGLPHLITPLHAQCLNDGQAMHLSGDALIVVGVPAGLNLAGGARHLHKANRTTKPDMQARLHALQRANKV